VRVTATFAISNAASVNARILLNSFKPSVRAAIGLYWPSTTSLRSGEM